MIAGCCCPSPGSGVRYAARFPTAEGYSTRVRMPVGGAGTGLPEFTFRVRCVVNPARASASGDDSAAPACDGANAVAATAIAEHATTAAHRAGLRRVRIGVIVHEAMAQYRRSASAAVGAGLAFGVLGLVELDLGAVGGAAGPRELGLEPAHLSPCLLERSLRRLPRRRRDLDPLGAHRRGPGLLACVLGRLAL